MRSLLAAVLCTLFSTIAVAHTIHHQHVAEPVRTWHCQDNSEALNGMFMFSKNDEAYFLLPGTGVLTVDMAELSTMDQAYINYRNPHHKKPQDAAITAAAGTQKPTKHGMNWQPVFLFLLLVVLADQLYRSGKAHKVFSSVSAAVALLVVLVLFVVSCKKSTDSNSGDTSNLTPLETLVATFAQYPNTTSTTYDSTYFYVNSQGIPEHDMMTGITAWIAQVPIPQDYTGSNAWSIPMNPEYGDSAISIEDHFQRGAIGIAANGIPIFDPINASGLVSKDIGELDSFGGHSGRGDDYHYHTAPLHLQSSTSNLPIAYALDGFAVYGTKEPDGSDMETLDANHGHEWNGRYHYHGTDTYPFMIGAMVGKVTLSGTAPQDQVEPQPESKHIRGNNIHPINSTDLIITSCVANSSNNGYLLTYTISGVEGSVEYSWTPDEIYTFVFHDVDGTTTTEVYP